MSSSVFYYASVRGGSSSLRLMAESPLLTGETTLCLSFKRVPAFPEEITSLEEIVYEGQSTSFRTFYALASDSVTLANIDFPARNAILAVHVTLDLTPTDTE